MNKQTKEQGFTLVELMITMVLSLIITYAIAQVLISSNQSSSSSDGVSQSQETARYAMLYLRDQIQTAGINALDQDDITIASIIGCNISALNDINACPSESNTGVITNAASAAGSISGDRLAVAWIPPSIVFNYPPVPPAPGEPAEPVVPPFPAITTDCSGTGFTNFSSNTTIVNDFWVGFDVTSNSNSLFCRGHLFDGTNIIESNSQQVIISGVEAMHVLYGEATNPLPTNSTRNVTQYVNASEVSDWEDVFAIKVAIMTRSISDVTNDISNKQYIMLDSGLYNFTDAVNRQVFVSTFSIANYQD